MKLFDPGHNPILGRLHGYNEKHRLRSKHYSEIDDFPEDAFFDVIDEGRIDVDVYENQDELFVVSKRFRDVIANLAEINSHPVKAGSKTVYVIEPFSDDDVSVDWDKSVESEFSKSGYNIVSAEKVVVETEEFELFREVRNMRVIAISAELEDAISAAGFEWTLQTELTDYQPYRENPYFVLRVAHNGVRVDEHELSKNVAATERPLKETSGAEDDADESWADIFDDVDEYAVAAAYATGVELPDVNARMESGYPKARLKKNWKDVKKAAAVSLDRMFNVNDELRAELEENEWDLKFTALVVRDRELKESRSFSIVYPPEVDWIDWAKSDVSFLWNSLTDKFNDLHPCEEAYTSTRPVVRIKGTDLTLVHEDHIDWFAANGFYLTPLHELFVCRNLDDNI